MFFGHFPWYCSSWVLPLTVWLNWLRRKEVREELHAKRMDKIATGVLYAISGIIVAILASLISIYLGPWLTPCILALLVGNLLLTKQEDQEFNYIVSFFLLVITMVISFPFSWSWDLPLSTLKGQLDQFGFVPVLRSCVFFAICRCRSLYWLLGLRCSSNTDFARSFQGPWPWPSLTCHRWLSQYYRRR